MSSYNVNLTLENIRTLVIMLLDIMIMWAVLYYAIRIVRSNSKTVQIFKGIILILIIDLISTLLGLRTLAWLTNMFINWGFLAIIILFQPELRSVLEKIGKSNVFSRINTLTGNEKENLVDQIVTATMLLSKDQTGALISIEQSHSLDDFIATGTRLDSDVSAELLTSIFVTSTPLHDGAVIIQGDKIACASAYFPPTNMELPSRYGARHRAAIGISEITDAVTIVVSEETGNVSITEGGKIMSVNRRQLRDYLLRVICNEETEVHSDHPKSDAPAEEPARKVVIQDDQKSDDKSTGNTGVLSKLAIRRQEEKEDAAPKKIEAESVVTSGVEISDASKLDEIHEQADEEAINAEIKLPHKKKRSAPSYPDNAQVRRFEEERREEQRREEAAAAEKARQEAEKKKQQEEAERKRQEEEQKKREEEVRPAPRMTPEQVQAAREKSRQLYQAKSAPDEEEKEEHTRFDTTKIDVSKLVGMDKDLDKTLSMIDSIADNSEKKNEKQEGSDVGKQN